MSTSRYGNYCRPKLQSLLEALRLDESYISAQGNYLRTAQGTDVLDLVGGFGSTILGHHHPAIKKVVTDSLSNNLAIHCQGAEQSEAACLAERLSALASTRCRYLVNFSNSGTESVEAALKHAYKKHFDHGRRTFERVSRILENVYVQLLNSELEPEIPGGRTLNKFREDLDETNIEQFEHFQNHAHVISFHGSFHGKSTSALKTTFNRTYREAFEGLSAIEPHFIDSAQPRRISEIAKEAVCRFYYPEILDGKIEIHTEQVTMVMAVMLETIRGEGGIRPLPQSTLEYLANEHSRLPLPLIVDEIQTGCGRLGSIFSYHQTPLRAVDPDYITLSKSLGGGLTKIGATLIREDVYDEDFGILHTSTFGEDALSAKVASPRVELLTSPFCVPADSFASSRSAYSRWSQVGFRMICRQNDTLSWRELRGGQTFPLASRECEEKNLPFSTFVVRETRPVWARACTSHRHTLSWRRCPQGIRCRVRRPATS